METRFHGGAVDCMLCGGEEETVKHIFCVCDGQLEITDRYGVYRAEVNWKKCWCLERKMNKMWISARRCSKKCRERIELNR